MFVVVLIARPFFGRTFRQTRATGTSPKQAGQFEEEQLGRSSGGPSCRWQQLNLPVFSTTAPPSLPPPTTFSYNQVLLLQQTFPLLLAGNYNDAYDF